MVNQVQIAIETLQGTFIIYLGIALGFLWMKTPLSKYRKQFVIFTINTITPLLIFFSIVRLKQATYWWVPVLGVITITIIGIILPKFFANLNDQPKPDAAEICTASFPNALNFPFPIIYALSPNALGAASIFLAATIVMRNTVGLSISGVELSRKNLFAILKFPPIIGIMSGFLYKATINDDSISRNSYIDTFFQIGIILTLMTVGFSIKKPNFEYKLPIFRVTITRFIFSGILALILILTLPVNRDMSIALFVQMIAPPAVYNGLYAEKFGLNTELTSQVIIAVTIIALLFLPIELLLIQIFFG